MYDDNSPLLEGGKYKFMLLKNVPAQHLLSFRGVTKDEELKIYINANLETIKQRAEMEKEKPKSKVIVKCRKISYLTEVEAMNEIVRIMRRVQENKKPIRVYKCFCGTYHLTSKAFSEHE